MSGPEDFKVPDLAPADRKIQNDRQRKQIPRFGKVRYLFFKYYAIQLDVRAALCSN